MWERHSYNDFAFTKVPSPGFDEPLYLLKSWIGLPGVITPMMRKKNESVIKAYRTTGIVRGAHPYALVVDDIQADKTPHTYDWRLLMEKDLAIGSTEPTPQSQGSMCDVTLVAKEMRVSNVDKIAAAAVSYSANDPKLLIRVLRCDQADTQRKLEPTMFESKKKDNNIFSLKVSSVEPRFMVMLYPYRPGEPVPTTTWDAGHNAFTVAFPEYSDRITTSQAISGKTDLIIVRAENGKTNVLAAVNQPVTAPGGQTVILLVFHPSPIDHDRSSNESSS